MIIIQINAEEFDQRIENAVNKALATIPQPEPEPEDRIYLDEACKITKYSKSWMTKATMKKIVPCGHYGNRLVFSRKDLQAWMEQQTIPVLNPSDVMSDRLAASAKRKG